MSLVEAPVAATVAEPAESIEKPRTHAGTRVLSVLALVLTGAAFLYPLIWLISSSLKDRAHVFDNALIPDPVAFGNYVEVWQAVPLLLWIVNSLLVGVAAAATATISSAVVAYGFARFRFRGRNVMFGLVLATMMLPGAVTMVPVYLEWHAVGLATTQIPLWAQNLFGSAFYVFLLRQFFLGLPGEVFDAAKVDGAGHLRTFARIALPLTVPAMIVVFVFELKAAWTDLIKPLIYLRDTDFYTLPRGLKTILDRFGEGGESQWELVLAASTIATAPMILLFLFAQRYFVRGLTTQ
ncbi:carbohydrate ABC transporter permease [Kibdelosporangium persicum]|uniref:Binding-protein-dependent transport systems inner membrane component n=1 Tax=Kibdelosporangium persicum TaxID=2698649 RepID=A0ABX2EVY3_9PSEU|nr:carbohydrate ABC transporter permease [Kibdelosporangium persicum]NRN63186.1 Binding-protein-dependent transport systems inner membrane component [Kibdelosporangium persicum]